MSDLVRIKMLKDYGQLKAGQVHKLDGSTGRNLITMGFAIEVIRKPRRGRK